MDDLPDSAIGRTGCMLLFIAIAFVSTVFALMSIARARRLREDSATTQAVILRRIETTESRPEYFYPYQFTVDGRRFEGDWMAHRDGSHIPGEKVLVTYRRSNPAYNNYGEELSARLETPALWWNVAGVAALLACVFGASIRHAPIQ